MVSREIPPLFVTEVTNHGWLRVEVTVSWGTTVSEIAFFGLLQTEEIYGDIRTEQQINYAYVAVN